jgi:twitching motility protein PilT
MEAFEQKKITEDTALLYCTKRGVVIRGIDNIKKARGESTTSIASLRMKGGMDSAANGPPVPASLKLK